MKTILNFIKSMVVVFTLLVFCPFTPAICLFFNQAWYVIAWLALDVVFTAIMLYCMMALAQAQDAYNEMYHEYGY